jgi:hypothetical protein
MPGWVPGKQELDLRRNWAITAFFLIFVPEISGMMVSTKIWGRLAMVATAVVVLLSVSCRKGDPFGIIQSDNPPPGIQRIADYAVSEFEDTLDLRFKFQAIDVVFERYNYAWECISKPAGAPEPKLLAADKPDATAFGLKRGQYQFRITASNKKGSSTRSFTVSVLEDTLKGKTIILPNQKWFIKDSTFRNGITFYYIDQYLVSAPERPDLFFRKRSGVTVQYRTEGESAWASFDGFETAFVGQKTFWSKFPNASDDKKSLHNKNVELRLIYR